jgi:uncharacterized protein (DUF58 family)
VSPTPLAAGLVALAALASTLVPVPVAAAAMAVVLVASFVDAWVVRRPPSVRRTVPPILSRGVAASLTLDLDGDEAGSVSIHQPAGPHLEVTPGTGAGSLRAEIVARRRGAHELAPPATRTTGPLGLGRWYHRGGDAQTIVVYPDLPGARRIALDVRHGRFAEEGTRTRGPLGLGTDFESIREYRPDDDIRQVNWRATARMGSPMSNQYRVERDREVVCLVDAGRLMAAPLADRSRLDAAVDVVAAMAAVAEEVGDRIGVIAFADRVLARMPPRRKGTASVLQAVYDLEPLPVDADYELAFRSVARSRRAFVLVLTDLLDRSAGAPLERALPLLVRHHEVAVASATDESLIDLLDTPASTLDEALRTAVAVDLLDERQALAARLEHAGATVVEASPQTLAWRCVGAYVRSRRRARL